MAGKDNLIPSNKRSKEEHRQIARNGGIKSGKVRKEKKTIAAILDGLDSRFLKQKIEQIKQSSLSDEKKKEYIEILKDSDNVMLFELYSIGMSKGVNATKLKAIEDVLDRKYGKSTQPLSGDVGLKITGLTFEVKE